MPATLDRPAIAKMNKESFELAEAIGDLFVENQVIGLRATLDVIAIETGRESEEAGLECVNYFSAISW